MKLEKDSKETPFYYARVERPWGFFDVYSENLQCTSKILYVKQGESLSLQYHFRRAQKYCIIDDTFLIQYSNVEVPEELINETRDHIRIPAFEKFLNEHLVEEVAKEGDEFFFKERILHSAKYIGPREYGRFFDIAFGINMEEGDIFRVADKYGREDVKNIKVKQEW